MRGSFDAFIDHAEQLEQVIAQLDGEHTQLSQTNA
jgi:hypothetical protein